MRRAGGTGWSHIQVWWIKIGRDTSETNSASPRPDHPSQGSNIRKVSPHNFWLQTPVGVGVVEETSRFSRDFSYRAHNGHRTLADPPPLQFSTRAIAGRAQVAYREKME